ncbi:hypothetical protein LPJ72_004556 [Coemansia sp. Benny D160-2]|nr:hypothetical protein LPJ72_004556 [Coemansia sp. Benny D160-2]
MVLTSYESGTLCWAKLKGYPCAWITPENLEPYEENLAKYGSKAKNRKDPSFADALKQAQNPTEAEEIIRRSTVASSSTSENESNDEDEDEDEDNDDDDDVEMNSAESEAEITSRRRSATKRVQRNGRGRKATISNKRASISNDSSSDETNGVAAGLGAAPKRSRTAAHARSASPEELSTSNAKREESASRLDTKDSSRSGTPSRHHSPEHTGYKSGPSPSKDDTKSERGGKAHQQGKNHGKPYYFLMQIRHKLQKTVIKGDVPDDLAPVDDLFRKLEDFDMTLELIQETKLGKVMRIIAGSDKIGSAPEEKFDIKGRAKRLAEKWRRLITRLREGSAELATPESPMSKSPENETRVQAVPEARSDVKSGEGAVTNGTLASKEQRPEKSTTTAKEVLVESTPTAVTSQSESLGNSKPLQVDPSTRLKDAVGDVPSSSAIGTNGTSAATASTTNTTV